ncbi:MAG: hypothetical protein M3220_22185 [Chloroflexota bacterium]|nr:hypothetical protein [Chloroflexota bacterium]
MEPRDLNPEPFDELISETLRERMGPPPGDAVWERIAREISTPTKQPLQNRLLSIMQVLFRTPLAQSAVALTILVILVVQPANYWMDQTADQERDQPSPTPTISSIPEVMPLPASKPMLPDGGIGYDKEVPKQVRVEYEQSPPSKIESTTIGGLQP